ncbi:ribbon-helix-helix domain-containing protein [Rhodobacter capsulatus]|uniref:hypothetical protein n=1 Tax=Rhodobacter capsulatus TaxID=1061 RepID=UPI0003D39E19|nr:hypothetical protein [Rhodobacter capsulatus]ETD85073.1 hypothetical protein U716_05590 [Rhodobacter capsulatus B6]
MSHQLINFNIPTGLKDTLDEIARAKRLSRTAIINQLLESYCRSALQDMASRPASKRPQAKQDEEDGMPLVPFLIDHRQFDGGWSL